MNLSLCNPLCLCASVVSVCRAGARRVAASPRRRVVLLATGYWLLATLTAASPLPAADWPTARGNLQRTGTIDTTPGPRTPAIVWVHKSQEHFIAAPTPNVKELYVSGLGAYNTAAFYALALDENAPKRDLWSKSAPFLKLPTVSAPAIVGDKILLGDGMHQTDGAALYCLQADSGRPLWQFAITGKLTHMEGTPAVAKGRVYIGGGDAGVFCLDMNKLTLDGKDMDLPALASLMDLKWKELQAKYEAQKRQNPDLAIPPSEDALPKAAPKLLWQAGKSQWHVDASLAVTDAAVIVSTAYLDTEKLGKRALVALKPDDGTPLWEIPLTYNPWAGATVVGGSAALDGNGIVLVGCSSIRFDTNEIPKAAGEVVALDLKTGQPKWRVAVPGGVLAALAAQDGRVIFTATDGKLRALDLETGQLKWTYDAKTPFFAGPALDPTTAYAPDLKGTLHAVSLSDGRPVWKLDVGNDPNVRLPGMVFGSPVLQAGRLYVATCNLEGDHADQPTAVVCIGDKSGKPAAPTTVIAIDNKARTITVPCKIAPRKLPELKEIYPIEVMACLPSPRGQKAHETVVVLDAKPSDIHNALLAMGLKPGTPARGDATPTGPEVRLFLEIPGVDGNARRVPFEQTLIDTRTLKSLPPIHWYFTGSVQSQPDPTRPEKVFGADLGGTLVALYPVTDETVFQSNLTMNDSTILKLETKPTIIPDIGTPAKLIIEAK